MNPEKKESLKKAKREIIEETILRVFANRDVYFARWEDFYNAFPLFTQDEIQDVINSMVLADTLDTPLLVNKKKGTCERVLALNHKVNDFKIPDERKYCARTKRFVGGYFNFQCSRLDALDIGIAEPIGRDRDLVWQ